MKRRPQWAPCQNAGTSVAWNTGHFVWLTQRATASVVFYTRVELRHYAIYIH